MPGKRCRVLYTQAWSGGGSELSLYELVRGLDSNKYEPVVLFNWPGRYRNRFEEAGVKVITLSEIIPKKLLPPEIPQDKGGINRSTSKVLHMVLSMYRFLVREPRLALHVSRIIKNEMVDIVHHNCGLNADRDMVLASVIAGVPQVSHFRLFGKLTLIARYLVRFVDAFIYNSNAVRECYTKLGIPPEKGHVIYNPIDLAAFEPDKGRNELRRELGLKPQNNLVCNVGRIVEWKGQDRFLRSMAEVIKAYPDTKVLIVGEAGPSIQDKRFERELRQLAEQMSLTGHIIFTGLRSDIPRIMVASDVVVHSAVKPEPFGRVIAEALMAGSPVVATAGGGVPEIVDDGVTGLLVPPGNINSMAEAIGQLLSNRDKARSMGMRARREAMERFTVQRHVRAVEHVYANIMDCCPARS